MGGHDKTGRYLAIPRVSLIFVSLKLNVSVMFISSCWLAVNRHNTCTGNTSTIVNYNEYKPYIAQLAYINLNINCCRTLTRHLAKHPRLEIFVKEYYKSSREQPKLYNTQRV